MKGIIYKAENLITGKVYIGQTIQKLETRIKAHYSDSKRYDYKFSKALRKYKKEDWSWKILEKELPLQLLDEKEIYYISQYNSFKIGYNSTVGGNSPVPQYSSFVYELYHPDFGIIKATKQELRKINKNLGNEIHKLLYKRNYSYKGFVLATNKDSYNKILKIHSLFHLDYGIITTTYNDFYHNYFNKDNGFSILLSKKSHYYKGWILAENKDNYNEIFNILTLEHPEFGKHTLPGKDFTKKFNLTKSNIYNLKYGKCKQSKGWKLVTNI